jgi:UDP-2,4-diacetamido-2,4,6-trideoxy-beta-L-altropyranose hydrolase
MRIGIRVDTSSAIGGGHIQRCLSLAHALRECGAVVQFVLRDLGLDGMGQVRAAGFAARALPAPAPHDAPDRDVPHGQWAEVAWRVDADQTCAALSYEEAGAPDWVVVDHYAFDARWHRVVADTLGCKIAVIDDLADRALAGDLLIDHNVSSDHRAKFAHRWPARAPLLGGPRFALLSPSYAASRKHAVERHVRSIGIFLGSSDPARLSELAWRACRTVARFTGSIEVVTTRANPTRELLAQALRSDPRTRLFDDLPDLATFFACHDLQIGAGGGASWERCCIGVPSVLMTVASNQRVVVPQLDALGVAIGLPMDADVQAVGKAVLELIDCPIERRQEMSAKAKALVDGMGARRAALSITACDVRLRPVTLDDAVVTHAWRNHEQTRSVSRASDPIELDAHCDWLAKALTDPRRHLWIACVGQVEVGVVRFDDDPTGRECEVSLYLDPSLQGLGLGAAVLLAGEAARAAVDPKVQHFVATVLPQNRASRHMFQRAGYTFVGDRGVRPFEPSASPVVQAL